jgi:hypothetical protein
MVRLIGGIAGALAGCSATTRRFSSMTVSFIGLYGAVKALSFVLGPLGLAAKAARGGAVRAGRRRRTSRLAPRSAAGRAARHRRHVRGDVRRRWAWTAATVALDTALAILTSPITLVIAAIARSPPGSSTPTSTPRRSARS